VTLEGGGNSNASHLKTQTVVHNGIKMQDKKNVNRGRMRADCAIKQTAGNKYRIVASECIMQI